MTALTQSQLNARWRAKRRRVTLYLEPGSAEAEALSKLEAQHGGKPVAAIKAALVTAADAC